jgi:hypothetical protein
MKEALVMGTPSSFCKRGLSNAKYLQSSVNCSAQGPITGVFLALEFNLGKVFRGICPEREV